MITGFSIEALLEEQNGPSVPAYSTPEGELEAVARGEKPVSLMGEWSRDIALDDEGPFAAMVSEALALGLRIVCEPIDGFEISDSVAVFALRDPELWRVSAYRLLRDAMKRYRWSYGAEFAVSRLLGYSDEQITEWIAYLKYIQCGWGGRTVYLLVSNQQKEMLVDLGSQCIAPAALLTDLVLFAPRGLNVVKPSSSEIVAGHGYSVARVAVTRTFVEKLFGHPRTWTDENVVSTNLRGSDPRELNSALESKVEFLSNGVWAPLG